MSYMNSQEIFFNFFNFKMGEITGILCADKNDQRRNKQWGCRKTGKNAVTVLMDKQEWMGFSVLGMFWSQTEKEVISMIMRKKAQIQKSNLCWLQFTKVTFWLLLFYSDREAGIRGWEERKNKTNWRCISKIKLAGFSTGWDKIQWWA